MSSALLAAMLANRDALPPCALCKVERARRPCDGLGPRPPAVTLVLGTLVCAVHAGDLVAGLELLPGILAAADELGWATP